MASPIFPLLAVSILLTFPSLSVVEARRRSSNCDRSLLSICYNQLQPFFLTNNLRLVLRGVLQNSPQRHQQMTAGNKHGRSQPSSALPLPLHRIYAEFREFCELFSTFGECLDAHGAADCLEVDVVSELNSVIVARRDRNINAIQQQQQQSPTDLIRDFDHYRRLANSFCGDTSENVRIHVVRCLAHGIAASSSSLDDHKGAAWADAQLMYVDGSASSLTAGSTAATCTRWLRQSQAPLLQSYFRQEGCGEHLQSTIKLSAFLAELTMRTTNATDAAVKPKFNVCVRHLSPKLFESIINETFHGLVTPEETMTPPVVNPTITIDQVVVNSLSKDQFLTDNKAKASSSYPILSIEESNRLSQSSSDYPLLQINSNKPLSESGEDNNNSDEDEDAAGQNQLRGVVIPNTADDKESNALNYDDGSVLGVSLMRSETSRLTKDSSSSTISANFLLSCFLIPLIVDFAL